MFDFSFSELLVVFLVAMLILGPKRLPETARVIGAWVSRIKRQFMSMKYQVEEELRQADMQQMKDGWEAVKGLKSDITEATQVARDSILSQTAEVEREVAALHSNIAELENEEPKVLPVKPSSDALAAKSQETKEPSSPAPVLASDSLRQMGSEAPQKS